MKSIHVSDLKEELVLTTNLMLDSKYLLSTPDINLDKETINRLKKWNYTQVYSTNGFVPIVSGTSKDKKTIMADDLKEQEEMTKVNELFIKSMDSISRVFDRYTRETTISINDLSDTVKELLNMIRVSRKYILRLNDLKTEGQNYMITHAVKCTILSLAVGDHMKLPQHKLIDLGTSAILHEIGMLKLPPDFMESSRKLNEKEQKMITAHPVLGYKILKEFALHRDVLMGVLEHHERMDGSGYPQKLKGEQLSLYGRIIAIACSYDAQISARPYSSAKSDHLSIIDMLQGMGQQYDESILRQFIFILSLYPIGSHVKLASGAYAAVVESNPENPKFPLIRMIIDKNGNILKDQPIIVASEESETNIVQDVSQEELNTQLNKDKV